MIIKTGEIYKADLVKSGNTDKGNWQLLVVKEKKKQMAIWAVEPIDIVAGGSFKVESIVDAALKSKKGADDKWYDQVEIHASVVAISKIETTSEMEEPVINDVELPF